MSSRDPLAAPPYEPCECCGRTDMDTGHGLCGFGWECVPCLTDELEGPGGSQENHDAHEARHTCDRCGLVLVPHEHCPNCVSRGES